MTNTVRPRRFIQCDVFTDSPVYGNALAVVLDAQGLSDAQMQSFAAWTNLAETTFIVPPDDDRADYRVRIFTPQREMPFAGHPTLGSCAAWLHAGNRARRADIVYQQCEIGIVEVHLPRALQAPELAPELASGQAQQAAFIAPPTAIEPLPGASKDGLLHKLKLASSSVLNSALLNNGPVWQLLELDSPQTVLSVDASLVKWPETQPVGLVSLYDSGGEFDVEVRMLAPSSGMLEDPITGSLNAAIAHWLMSQGRLDRPMQVSQGRMIGRRGHVTLTPDPEHAGRVLVGGQTHILIDGTVML